MKIDWMETEFGTALQIEMPADCNAVILGVRTVIGDIPESVCLPHQIYREKLTSGVEYVVWPIRIADRIVFRAPRA